MKRLMIGLFSLVFFLGLTGAASAVFWEDVIEFDPYVKIAENSVYGFLFGLPTSYTYAHATPADFAVPPDAVQSATLSIFGYYINGNNDVVKVEGATFGTLTPGGNYGTNWVWSWNPIGFKAVPYDNPSVSNFNILPTFDTWLAGTDLNVNIQGNGSLGDKYLELSKSVFTLDYTPVPEPGTLLLLGAGLLGLAAYGRKRMMK